MDYFMKLYKKKTGKDVRKDNRAVQKLRREVEKAKRALSSQQTARIEIESFFEGNDFSETLTRAKFEELNMVSYSSFINRLRYHSTTPLSCFDGVACFQFPIQQKASQNKSS